MYDKILKIREIKNCIILLNSVNMKTFFNILDALRDLFRPVPTPELVPVRVRNRQFPR